MPGAETGNMLIMTYAAALTSGNGSLISRYVCQSLLIVSTASELNQLWQYSVLTSWTDYLSNMSLNTVDQYVGFKNQLPTIKICELDREDADLYGGAGNQSNLAIKGIIAIGAMSKMSLAAGHVADADKYSVCNDLSD